MVGIPIGEKVGLLEGATLVGPTVAAGLTEAGARVGDGVMSRREMLKYSLNAALPAP